jgi:hypothetical protein
MIDEIGFIRLLDNFMETTPATSWAINQSVIHKIYSKTILSIMPTFSENSSVMPILNRWP